MNPIMWNRTTERLPERSGLYLCVPEDVDGAGSRFAIVLPFSVVHGKFNASDFPDYNPMFTIPVAYWMELLEHPEGGVNGVEDKKEPAREYCTRAERRNTDDTTYW